MVSRRKPMRRATVMIHEFYLANKRNGKAVNCSQTVLESAILVLKCAGAVLVPLPYLQPFQGHKAHPKCPSKWQPLKNGTLACVKARQGKARQGKARQGKACLCVCEREREHE